jgi:hypothetical protein
MNLILTSLICLIIGLWLGIRAADSKWRSNATEPYHLVYGNWLYKVRREKRPKENTF